MKKAAVLIAFGILLAGATSALAEIKVTGDAYVGVFDKYLWRGYDLSGSTPVAQGGMDLSFGGLTLSYWTNGQFKDDTVDSTGATLLGGDANETDITVNYALSLGEMVSVNVGNVLYALDGAEDTNELYLAATLNTILAPTLKAYYDWDEFQDDRFYTLSIGHSVDLGKVTLTGGALASYADSQNNYEPWNAELSVKADIALTDQIKVTPSFLYSTPLADDAQAAIDTEMASGLTVTMTF